MRIGGDAEIGVEGQTRLELSEVRVGRDLTIRGSGTPSERILLDRVSVGRRMHLEALILSRGLDITKSRIGYGLYTAGLQLDPGLDNMALRIEDTYIGGYLDLRGIETLRGGLSLRGTRTHTYRDRRWPELSRLDVAGFEWWVMPDDHEKGLRRWRSLLPSRDWRKFRERLSHTDRLRAAQPPLEIKLPSLLGRLMRKLAHSLGWDRPSLWQIIRRWK